MLFHFNCCKWNPGSESMSEVGQILQIGRRSQDTIVSEISHGNITSEWELIIATHYLHLPGVSQE